jgi:ATP-dependent HslUV protease ATP-binding subunit HslU
VADAFTLFEKLEEKLERYPGNLPKAVVELAWLDELTPRQIVAELDKYIVGQTDAKRAVAIALRNRWRRQRVDDDLREEIMPNNIILIGPTGVGKTEIARRLARLAGAPFVKVEASKFTEVGYVGRDVESMVRDLVDVAVNMVREEREATSRRRRSSMVEERLLDLLLPPRRAARAAAAAAAGRVAAARVRRRLRRLDPRGGPARRRRRRGAARQERRERTREKLRTLLRDGKLEERKVDVEVTQSAAHREHDAAHGRRRGHGQHHRDAAGHDAEADEAPHGDRRRGTPHPAPGRAGQARRHGRGGERGARARRGHGHHLPRRDRQGRRRARRLRPDVSREGVQRDLLPIVEGSTVQTKYGMIRTDHILFIAAGAFHVSKPSDLIPELQGRFPIRVELKPLTEEDFVRILTEPKNALTRQYQALIAPRTWSSSSRTTACARSRASPPRSTAAWRTSARAACTRC